MFLSAIFTFLSYCNFGIKSGIRCSDFFNKKVQKQTFTLMAVKLRVLSLQLVFLSINKKLRVSKMYQKNLFFDVLMLKYAIGK